MGIYVCKSGLTWRLIFEEGKHKRAMSKKSPEAASQGFSPTMSLEEAKAHAKKLNYTASQSRAMARARKAQTFQSVHLGDLDRKEFEQRLERHNIRETHWRAVQKLIVDCGLHPSAWEENIHVFYSLVRLRRWRPNYWRKLRKYLNLWGTFICKKENKFFVPLDAPNPRQVRAMSEDAKRASGESLPLTPEILERTKKDFTPEEWNWLFVSLWLGLRPREVNNLLKSDRTLWGWSGGSLEVFQEKLCERAVPTHKCWKLIELKEPEQKLARLVIEKGNFTQPTGFKIKKILGKGYSAYAGRKGVVDLLKSRGYSLAQCRDLCGHLTSVTTEKYYESRGRRRG